MRPRKFIIGDERTRRASREKKTPKTNNVVPKEMMYRLTSPPVGTIGWPIVLSARLHGAQLELSSGKEAMKRPKIIMSVDMGLERTVVAFVP